MDDGGSATTGIIIFLILILVDFIIFGFIAAMQNVNETAVEKMAKEGNKRAALLLKYIDKTDRYMHVCKLLILTAHMLLGFLLVPLWRTYFSGRTDSAVLAVCWQVAAFLAQIFLVLVFGIYTPEKVAARKPDVWAMKLVMPVHALEIIFFPLIKLSDISSNLLARVFGVDPLSDTDDVTEEEIISMVNEGHEQGMLLASEAEMIHNIFEFGDKEAKDIMIHRKNMIALDGNLTFYEALQFMRDNNYSRFPVYLEDIDNIIGVLHIKDALDLSLDQSAYCRPVHEIDGLVREVDFIPETRNINTLFSMMQRSKSHMVIVVDEYGQTSGIVAMEDIIEEIVGNIEDEHDEEQTMFEKVSEGVYLADGMADFGDVIKMLEIEPEDSDDFETLNGFLISLIDKIPNDHEEFSITAYGYLFEILSVENKMIHSVRITKVMEDKEENPAVPQQITHEACQNEEMMVE
jgi:putative hemolysin